jgi:hypothetical protein
VARDAHRQALVGRALDADDFDALGELPLALLQVQVLHVAAGAGEAPGDALVASGQDARHTRQRAANGVEAGRVQVREVPHRRRREPEVRVVGEQRLARGGAAAGERPAVGSGQEVGRLREAQRLALEAAVQLLQIADLGRRVAGVGREELVDARQRERTRELQAQQLATPIGAEVPRHHLHPGHGICCAPAFGLYCQKQKLDGQHRVAGEKGVDAGGIGIEQAPRFGVEVLQVRFRHAAHAQGAQEAIGIERRGAEDLGEAPGGDAAAHFHLPQPVLRMQEAEGEIRVGDRGGIDVWHVVAVAQYFHRRDESGQRDFALCLRQRLAQPGVGGADRDQRKSQQEGCDSHRWEFCYNKGARCSTAFTRRSTPRSRPSASSPSSRTAGCTIRSARSPTCRCRGASPPTATSSCA